MRMHRSPWSFRPASLQQTAPSQLLKLLRAVTGHISSLIPDEVFHCLAKALSNLIHTMLYLLHSWLHTALGDASRRSAFQGAAKRSVPFCCSSPPPYPSHDHGNVSMRSNLSIPHLAAAEDAPSRLLRMIRFLWVHNHEPIKTESLQRTLPPTC
eukprot:TRINITY_DN3800_c0_g1_i1.p1 TRINITY_DN3800_c0_g1~~TRINITY_DN3800_c0_g1_i1.p1  ORF type:complete len:154 (+),score=5.41 TRINITY_DN3800_c0_g1_i1:779-1240(+)